MHRMDTTLPPCMGLYVCICRRAPILSSHPPTYFTYVPTYLPYLSTYFSYPIYLPTRSLREGDRLEGLDQGGEAQAGGVGRGGQGHQLVEEGEEGAVLFVWRIWEGVLVG